MSRLRRAWRWFTGADRIEALWQTTGACFPSPAPMPECTPPPPPLLPRDLFEPSDTFTPPTMSLDAYQPADHWQTYPTEAAEIAKAIRTAGPAIITHEGHRMDRATLHVEFDLDDEQQEQLMLLLNRPGNGGHCANLFRRLLADEYHRATEDPPGRDERTRDPAAGYPDGHPAPQTVEPLGLHPYQTIFVLAPDGVAYLRYVDEARRNDWFAAEARIIRLFDTAAFREGHPKPYAVVPLPGWQHSIDPDSLNEIRDRLGKEPVLDPRWFAVS